MGVYADAWSPLAVLVWGISLHEVPRMNAQATVGRSGLRQIALGHWPMVTGAIVALALASGVATAFGTAVERLTVYSAAAPEGSYARMSVSAPHVADRRDAGPRAVTNASSAYVVDRWFDELGTAAP
jgi:hypothetical protein